MASRWLGLAIVALAALSSGGAWVETPHAEPDLALSVARLLDSQGTVVPSFVAMLPGETARELAQQLLGQQPEIWAELDMTLAGLLRETFTHDQLGELHEFLSSETGRAWVKASPWLFERLLSDSQGAGSYLFRMASIGCVVGLLAPNIEAAKRTAGLSSDGIPEELLEPLRPLRDAATQTCDCILAKSHERWPSSNIGQLMLRQDVQEYIQELLRVGTCPMPVARGPGSGS